MGKLQPFLIFLFSLLLAGCPQLPEYARPRVAASAAGCRSVSTMSAFPYRALVIGDFRAPSLPAELSEHGNRFLAHSSIQIRPTAATKSVVSSAYSPYFDTVIWSGRIVAIGFEAVMLPDRSWWNPKVTGEQTAYVLQHEQIHFALVELAARRLTRRAQQDIANLFVVDSSRQGVEEQLEEKISALIQAEQAAILEEHTAFDEDASLYFDPKKQQQWFDRVSRKLQE
jgi:hypothetical protein